jgi:hypothetical protein
MVAIDPDRQPGLLMVSLATWFVLACRSGQADHADSFDHGDSFFVSAITTDLQRNSLRTDATAYAIVHCPPMIVGGKLNRDLFDRNRRMRSSLDSTMGKSEFIPFEQDCLSSPHLSMLHVITLRSLPGHYGNKTFVNLNLIRWLGPTSTTSIQRSNFSGNGSAKPCRRLPPP